MKFLFKCERSSAKGIAKILAESYGMSCVTDLISGESGIKFITVDSTTKGISLYNKINEAKIRAIKIDLGGSKICPSDQLFIADIIANADHVKMSTGIIGEINVLTISFINPRATIPFPSYDSNVWHSIVLESAIEFPSSRGQTYIREKRNNNPDACDVIGRKSAIALLDINYSFSDFDSLTGKDIISHVRVYTTNALEEFMAANIDFIIESMMNEDISADLIDELTSTTFNLKFRKAADSSGEMLIVGLRGESGKTMWAPIDIILQYLDMPRDVFKSCINNFADLEEVLSHDVLQVPRRNSSDDDVLRIYTNTSILSFDINNVLKMNASTFDLIKNKIVNVPECDFMV
jgi:hypothetical protein